MSTENHTVPICRIGMSTEDLAKQADRSVLYGAILLAQRPNTRIKPHIRAAVDALLPAVQAFLGGHTNDQANFALDYAQACGGEAFLLQKRQVRS
jgi:hypothetical protein